MSTILDIYARCEALTVRCAAMTMCELEHALDCPTVTRNTWAYITLDGLLDAMEIPRHAQSSPIDQYAGLGYLRK